MCINTPKYYTRKNSHFAPRNPKITYTRPCTGCFSQRVADRRFENGSVFDESFAPLPLDHFHDSAVCVYVEPFVYDVGRLRIVARLNAGVPSKTRNRPTSVIRSRPNQESDGNRNLGNGY